MERGWRIELLGELRARRGVQVLTRFPKQLAASLLAYLACHPQHPHTRDVLLEALCPDLAMEDARNSLRVALHLLRRQLEPPGTPQADFLLIADRRSIGLHPAAFTTDVAEFEAALRAAARAASPDEQLSLLSQAVDLYRGELLAGFTEEWVFTERRHLTEQYLDALHLLVSGLEQEGHLERALAYGRRAVSADPLREEAHYDLMRLYAAAGMPSATLQQYQELERLLREELNEKPSATARALAEELRRNARTIVVARSARVVEPPAAQPLLGAIDHRQQQPAVPAPTGEPFATGSPAPSPFPIDAATTPLVTPAPEPRLPPQFTRFFGREEEIARVTELLGIPGGTQGPDGLLVTLTGPGGSGKTRLAIAVAGRLQQAFGGAVAFVPLAELTEPSRIADAVADALGLARSAEVQPLEQVVEALRSQPWLLVLDNFEQLVEDGALLVRTLLERAAGLTCLVTSRQRLNVAGEQEFVVLPLPTPRRSDPPERLRECISVQLFIDRARAVRPDFQVTEANAAAVAALCDRLEGLPLALELAAARSPMLTPAQMLAHLEQRFALLVSRQRDLPARHRTLRATVEGSYQLLSPELRRLLARLSVFRGGWTLEAAEAVCGGEGVGGWGFGVGGSEQSVPTPNTQHPTPTLDCLEQLREASLILAEEQGDAVRYRLLETLREYAWERLAESGEMNTVRDRHRDWYLQLAEQVEVEIRGSGREAALRAPLEAELDNFRAVLAWCQEEADANPGSDAAEAGLRLADALIWFWYSGGYPTEGLQWLEGALARGGQLPAGLRASALFGAAGLAHIRGDRGDRWRTLVNAARREYEKALALARREGDRLSVAWTLFRLAEVTAVDDDLDAAWSLCVESRPLFEELGEPFGLAGTLEWLARIALSRGDRRAARPLLEERLALCRELGGPYPLIHALGAMGHLMRDEGDYARARSLYEESLVLRQKVGDRFALAQSLEDFAVLAGRQGQTERAVRLLGAGEAFCETLGARPPVAIAAEYERTVAEGRAALGEAAFAAGWAEGRAMPLEAAVTYALEEVRGG